MTKGGDPAREKRLRVFEAATRLLKREGLKALSFETVAGEAGLSRQLVRYHFQTLDALILGLCEHLGNGYRERLVAGVIEVEKVARLGFFLDFFFDLADGHPMPDDMEVYDSLLAHAVGSPELRRRLCGQYEVLGNVVIHELIITHPQLDPRAAEELSYLFVQMMHAHWSYVATLGYDDGHGRITRRAMDRLIASYLADPSPAAAELRPWTRPD